MARLFGRSEKPSPAFEQLTQPAVPPPASLPQNSAPTLAEPPDRRRPSRRRNGGRADQNSQNSQGSQNGQNSQSSQTSQSSQNGVHAEQSEAEQFLSLLQRQNQLLEQQGKAIKQLAETQRLLTDTLLGNRGEEAPPARIEVLPRLAIFVDVPNILYGAEAHGVRLNWGKVADFLSHGRTLVRAIAYSPISDDPSAREENERFVVPFLDHGYRIATKQLKRFRGGSVKANFDVELAIDVLTMSDRVDVIVLVSGDGDFRRLVEIVGARGVRVEVMAFGKSTAAELRQVADRYIDIAQYADQLLD